MTKETKRIAELETALANARQALLDGNWSLALGYTELALGLHRKAA